MHFRGNPAPALHCSKDILPCIFRHLAPSWNATLEPCKILHIFTITNSNNASPRCKTINGWRQFKAAMGHQLSTFGGRQDASRTCEHKAQQISLNRFRRQEIYHIYIYIIYIYIYYIYYILYIIYNIYNIYNIYIIYYIYMIIEGSSEVKLPTIWTDGKAEVGRVREEKGRREKIKEETVRRKKIQVCEKVRKSPNTMFFQWFVAPEGWKK